MPLDPVLLNRCKNRAKRSRFLGLLLLTIGCIGVALGLPIVVTTELRGQWDIARRFADGLWWAGAAIFLGVVLLSSGKDTLALIAQIGRPEVKKLSKEQKEELVDNN